MNKHTTLSLNDHSAEFIEHQIDAGKLGSASDVVAAGLRLLKAMQEYLAYVRAALIEGESSRPPEPFDRDELIERMRQFRSRFVG